MRLGPVNALGYPEWVTVTYYLYDSLLGESTYPLWRTNGDRMRRLSNRAHFCSHCGMIWGRLVFEPYGDRVGRDWHAVTEPCPQHGGGSLLDNEAIDSASTDVLRHELTVPQTETL